jgi:autotransporter translocation and assembly factor TamB
MSAPDAGGAPRRGHRWRRLLRQLVTTVLVVVVGAIGLLFYAASESGLPRVMQQIERLTDGRLQVSGASGSLLSTFRAQELR